MRPPVDAERGGAAGGREREIGGIQDTPGRERFRPRCQLLSAPADVLTRLRWLPHVHFGAIADRVLLHHDAVRSRRKWGAGEDARRFTRLERSCPGRVARGDLAGDAQRTTGIGGAQGVAVHHGDVRRRLVAPGADALREHPSVGLRKRNVFSREGMRAGANRCERLVQRRDHLLDTREKQKSPGRLAEALLSIGGRRPSRSGVRRRSVGGAEERTRTSTGLPPPDPESGVSANSTTSARRQKSRGDLTNCMIQVKVAASRGTRMDNAPRPVVACPTRAREKLEEEEHHGRTSHPHR